MEDFHSINALRVTSAIREALKRCPFPTFEVSCHGCGEACLLADEDRIHQALDEGCELLCEDCAASKYNDRGPSDSSLMSPVRQWLEQEMQN